MAKSKTIPIAIRPYVFGSWISGKPNRWSDIEPHGVHPRDFKPKSNALVHEVVEYGIKIK